MLKMDKNFSGDYVMREVLFLCEIINTHAEGEPPNRIIRFGPLFNIYAYYSDKVNYSNISIKEIIKIFKFLRN